MNNEEVRCQGCLKVLESRFELERQLCHLCFVQSEVEWERMEKKAVEA